MIARFVVAALALLVGLGLAAAVPAVPNALRQTIGLGTLTGPEPVKAAVGEDEHGHDAAKQEAEEDKIVMTGEQIATAGIRVAAATSGLLTSQTTVPAVLAANQDRLARVTARVAGTVAEVRKGYGDQVVRGDVLAVLESRDVSDAKGDYLTALRTLSLAQTTLARESKLWRQRISAEQDFIQAKAAVEEAGIRVDVARQRLSTLGLVEVDITELPRQPAVDRRRIDVRAPIDGEVTARTAVVGAAVTPDAELFSIADLSTIWVEMSVPPRDLAAAKKGGSVEIVGEGGAKAEGRIVFLSPMLDPETRSARAIAEIANADKRWQPGAFVTARLATGERRVNVMAPRNAIQDVGQTSVVFVRTRDGFERRDVTLGQEGAGGVEVTSGLEPGTEIAVDNVFALKAELGKAEASHSH